MRFYSLPETEKLLGIGYHRLYYATITGVVMPLREGRARLYSEENLETLRRHFANTEGG